MEERLKQLIEELVQIPGPSGQEELVAAYLQEQFKPYADEAWIDKSGNSIAKFNGTSGRTIVVTGHMDEVFTVVEQVRDGLRQLLVAGAIAPGEKLPSVRQLASQLAINPNTIQRAYEALEQDGYVYSVPGKGSFAAQRDEIDHTRREELLARLDEVAGELMQIGMTPEEIAARCAERRNLK